MKLLKKIATTIALATTLFTTVPAPKANAGLILLPAGVGVVLIVLGVVYDRLGLFILDGEQTLQDQLATQISEKYSFIDDAQAVKELASLIASKVESADLNADKTVVSVSREEILKILAPTGLVELETLKVEALIKDLN